MRVWEITGDLIWVHLLGGRDSFRSGKERSDQGVARTEEGQGDEESAPNAVVQQAVHGSREARRDGLSRTNPSFKGTDKDEGQV